MKKSSFLFLLVSFLLIIYGCGNKKQNIFRVGPQADGSVLVPSNQLLRPAGYQVYLPGRPVDLALTPGSKFLIVKNKDDLNLIRLSDTTILQSLAYPYSGASFTGLCLSPDGKTVFVTDAENRVCIAKLSDQLEWAGNIFFPDLQAGGPPVPGGIDIDPSGEKIFVTLSRDNSLAIVNLHDTSITRIKTGIAPFSVIHAAGNKAYVSNWGGRLPLDGEPVFNTSGSQVLVDPKTGIANNGSVTVVDLNRNTALKDIEVGLHPCDMVLSPDKHILYVACANSDIISIINTGTDEVTGEISVDNEGSLFGSSPNDLTISPDGRYLYVANGTDNAICVISTETPYKIMGYIPTGWYPGSVILDGQKNCLYVANIKGIGSRNKGGNSNGFNSHDHLGTVSFIPLPGEDELDRFTKTVTENNSLKDLQKKYAKSNRKVPVPQVPGQASHFRHVVYIIKENRTYDQVFGDMEQGNGDTSLVIFGREVTPNQHLLAEKYVLLDNFYCSGVLSADGHQWTDEAYVTDYLEKSFGGFSRSYPYDGDDALAYASSGFIWDNVLNHGLTFRDYGEFVKAEITPSNSSFTDIYKDFTEGTNRIKIRAGANLEQLSPYLCPSFTGFPNTVPDIYRASEFIKELKEFEKTNDFPNFIIMLLPNNHTSGTSPGMPTPRASVADNDLALGQIVEAISESRFWKETCILVTEDDPQNGFDHVDGHRTVGLVISPYTKRGEVISTYYSQISMVRTIEDILGLPPMNQLDMSAEGMADCFTDLPDFSPYRAVKNNIPLDEMNPALVSLEGDQLFWAKKSMEQDLGDVDRIDEDTFNRIIWYSVKGYDRPYPDLNEGKEF